MSDKELTHMPVLLKEVTELLVADPDGLFVDATLGLGGHAEAVLGRLSPQGRLLGIDLDPEALALSSGRLAAFGGRFRARHGNFRNIAKILQNEGFFPLPQYLDADRANARVIVAHLGNGASMCAMRDGRSVASTMGFTALDGLPIEDPAAPKLTDYGVGAGGEGNQ